MSLSNPDKINKEAAKEIKSGWQLIWHGIKSFLHNLTNLNKGLDREGTIVNIRNHMRMQGANSWMLMCSIMIACIGLDQNSQAVIIGAMLISPLMSPILGVGLSFGINDIQSLRISLQHFGISIGIALFTSTLYFLFTPFGEVTSEIINRTAPTLLDAGVALFGGVAGIVSGSQKDKTNAIPGVAIATALMPPLCVTGFGLANLIKHGWFNEDFGGVTTLNNLEITFNSLYLFFLNATLVAIATYVIVRAMNFPLRKYANHTEKRRTNFYLLIFGILIIIPSLFILNSVLHKVETQNVIDIAIHEGFGEEIIYIDDWVFSEKDSINHLLVKVYKTGISKSLSEYQAVLSEKLPDFHVQIISTSDVDINRVQALESRLSELDQRDSLYQGYLQKEQEVEAQYVIDLRDKIASLSRDSELEKNVAKEVLDVYDDYLEGCRYIHPIENDTVGLIVLKWKRSPSDAIQNRIFKMIKTRTGVADVEIAKL